MFEPLMLQVIVVAGKQFEFSVSLAEVQPLVPMFEAEH